MLSISEENMRQDHQYAIQTSNSVHLTIHVHFRMAAGEIGGIPLTLPYVSTYPGIESIIMHHCIYHPLSKHHVLKIHLSPAYAFAHSPESLERPRSSES